jgi:hypothetical protein
LNEAVSECTSVSGLFFRVIQTNAAAAPQFAVKFVFICIPLATDAPDAFDRGVTRIFLTISAALPSPFVAYYCPLLRFVQFRSVILRAEMPKNDRSPPIANMPQVGHRPV